MHRQVTAALLALAIGLPGGIAAAQDLPNDQPEAVRITKGPRVENATGSAATIAWSTNVSSGTVVRYGTDPNNLSQKAQTPWGGLTHRVIIKNLQPSTTYYYRVDSSNAQDTGTSVASDLLQFQTKDASIGSQKALPERNVLAGPVVQDLTPTAATLWWHSEQSAPSQVMFGLSQASLDRVAEDIATGNDHRAQLAGLEPGKTYYFSVDTANGSPAATGQFSTPQQEAPSSAKITNGPVIEYVGHNHAIIAWSTSAPASTIVKYGTDPNALSQTAQAAWGSTTHRVDIKNLQPNTKYYFAVVSNESQGTGSMTLSAPGQLHTMGQGQQALALTPSH